MRSFRAMATSKILLGRRKWWRRRDWCSGRLVSGDKAEGKERCSSGGVELTINGRRSVSWEYWVSWRWASGGYVLGLVGSKGKDVGG